MKTLAEVKTWLNTPSHIRIILVKIEAVGVSGTPTTFYLSSKPFTTTSTDTPTSTAFDACLVGGVSFNGELLEDGGANIGFGDIEIENTGGTRDAWLNYIWVNKKITIYIGDPQWTFADYYSIFTGLISDISVRDLNSLNLIIVDKSQKLNNPISETLMTTVQGSTASDVLVPLTFGECFNITPVVSNSVTSEYQVHNGAIEDIIEVRDNGLPVLFTKNLAQGKFTLTRALYGQLTCSVQGDKTTGTYYNNVPDLIKVLVKNYGPVANRLTDSDIDLTNFASYGFTAETSTQPVGVYCTNRENLLDICNQLAQSIGCRITFNAGGLLQLIRYDVPSPTETNFTLITEQDIENNSISIASKVVVKATTKLAYCKNWTPQESGLAEGIVAEHLPIFSDEWLYQTNTNATTVTNYQLDTQPQQEDTLLISSAGAATEAARRTALRSTARYVYEAVCYPHMLFLNLGDFVKLQNPRYGLSAGKLGTVVRVDKDWIAGRITIGVLV